MTAIRPVIVLGAGGHATVLLDCLELSGREVLGMTAPGGPHAGWRGVPVLGDDDVIVGYPPDDVELVNGLGTVSTDARRRRLFERWSDEGYSFASVVHPSAIIARDITAGEGVQIMAGVVIQPGCTLGADTIVNTRASVDHDAVIGAHVHIAPGCVLSGGVVVGEGAHLGTGCTVIQGVRIGRGALVAAGAVVVNDIPDGGRVRGVPARPW